MTAILQAAFVLAAALTWVAVGILVVNLRRASRGKAVREVPAPVAGQAALLFAGTCLVTATVTRGTPTGALDDLFLYAAVFGGAAATVTWAAEGPAVAARPRLDGLLRTLALGVPVAAGVLGGVIGLP